MSKQAVDSIRKRSCMHDYDRQPPVRLALFVKPLQAAHKDGALVGIQARATLFLIFENPG